MTVQSGQSSLFPDSQIREIISLCRAEANLALAIEWLEAAAITVSAEEELEASLQSELASARRLHDKLWEEAGGAGGGAGPSEGLFISRVVTDLGNVSSARQLRERERGRSDLSSLQFSLLCRGESLPHTKTLPHHQQCRVSTEEDPYFLLGECGSPVLSLPNNIFSSSTHRGSLRGSEDSHVS